MLTKYDLRKYKAIKAEILQLQEQINELESVMVAPKIPQLTGMPFGGSSEPDKIGNIVAKASKLRDMYYAKLTGLVELQEAIENAIAGLDSKEQLLIRLYYFSGYTWEEVAVRLNYSWQHIHRLHRAILDKLAVVN